MLGGVLSLVAIALGAGLAALERPEPAAPGASAGEKEVLKALEDLADAGLHRDADRIAKLYTPAYFHTNADGSVMTLADVLAHYRAPTETSFDSSKRDEVRVALYGDTAVVSDRTTLHGTRQGQELTTRFRVTTVLVRAPSRSGPRAWLVASSHASFLGTS